MVSGEHGIGYAKKDYLDSKRAPDRSVMGRIKGGFDPDGILNPQKICT